MVDPSVYPYYQRLTQNPDDAEALFVLWQWYGDRGDFQQLAMLVEQVAGRRLDPSSAADLFFRAGELWAKNVGRVDKAVGNYRRAFELDPNQLPAVEAARGIYLQLGNFKLAAQLFERQLAVTGDPALRLGLLRELAAVRQQMGDPSGQAAALEAVIELTPDDYEAMRELAGAYLARAQSPGGDEQDSIRAATLLATIAQGLGGEHTLAFAEAALDAWGGEENAFQIVREMYTAAGRGEELALRQINFVAANPDSALAPAVRVELAELYASAGQFEDAIVALAPLAEQDPAVARRLADLYRQANRPAELVALLTSLPPSPDPTQRMADLREIAEVYGQQGEREAMIAALREILAIDPTDAEALALVEDDLRARNAFEELRGVLYAAARAPSAAPDAKRARLREIALLSEQRMGDVPGAIEAWRALLNVEHTDEEAAGALERLFSRAERWDELSRFIEKRASGATDLGDRRALLERLADVQRERRNDPVGEVQALRALWSIAPEDDGVALRLLEAARGVGDHGIVTEVLRARAEQSDSETAMARWTELAQHLEYVVERDEAIQAWQHVAALDPAYAPAWDAVERLFEQTGRHELLLETLVAHAEGPAAGEHAAALHARAAEIARSLGDVPVATAQAQSALELSPDDEEIASLLMDMHEASGERDKLTALLRDRVERTSDPESRIGLLRRLARTVGQTDPENAARVWGELREASSRAGLGDDAEALEALCGFAEVSGDSAALAQLLLESAQFETDPAQQRALLLRRAEIQATELARPDDAVASLRELAERPDNREPTAWGRLAELAAQTGKHELAAEAYEKQLPLIEDDEQRAAAAGRLADLCEKQLGDVPRTIRALEAQYDADPTDYTVVTRLAKLTEQEGRWADVVKYLDVLLEVEGDDEEMSVLAQRIAEIAEQHLGATRKAFDTLAPLAKNGDIAALDALRGVAERGKHEGDLVPLLTDLASRVGDPAMRADLWREIARRSEEALGDKGAALEGYLAAVVAQPSVIEGLDPIERLARALRDTHHASQAYGAVLAATDDPAVLHDVATRGVTFLEEVGAPEAALELAMLSQARVPGDDALLDAIVRLAPPARRGDEMFIAFDRRRNASRDESERYGLMLRAAEAAIVALGDRETGFDYLRMAVTQSLGGKPTDDERLALLESTAREADKRSGVAGTSSPPGGTAPTPPSGLRAGVAELYVSVAEEQHEDNPRGAAMLLRRAADMYADELGQRATAFDLLARAIGLWPADLAAADRLEKVGLELNRGGDVAALFQRVIDDAYEPATARAYQARRAALLADTLGRVDEAVEALRALIEIAPKDLDAVRALQAMLRKHARWQDLLMALERELEVGAPDRLAVLREIAQVWDARLRNAFEAKDAWKRVLKLAPEDAEARAALDRLEKRRAAEPIDDEPAPADDEEIEQLDEAAISDASSRELRAPPPDPIEPYDAPGSPADEAHAAPDPFASGRGTASFGSLDGEERAAPPNAVRLSGDHEEGSLELTDREALRRAAAEFDAAPVGMPSEPPPADPAQFVETAELPPEPAESRDAAPFGASRTAMHGTIPPTGYEGDAGTDVNRSGSVAATARALRDEADALTTTPPGPPDPLDELEELQEYDHADAEALSADAADEPDAEAEEIDAEEIEPEDEVSALESLARMADRPPSMPPPRHSLPPPPPAAPPQPPRKT